MNQEIVLQARIAYFLGNYGKVLEIWQQFDDSKVDDLEYYYFLVSRALIASRELKPKTINLTKKPTQKLLEISDIVGRFMGPLIVLSKPSNSLDQDRKFIEDALKKIKESIPSQNQKIIQLICAYLSVNSCDVDYVLNLEFQNKDRFQQELYFLQLMIYLRGRRFDLAEKILLELKKYDDEDILSYLGQIYCNIYNCQPDQAIKNINETKDRFGESGKLMNLMISCLINLGQYDVALEFGQKLQQALIEKEQFTDRAEIETCLSNLIVLSELTYKLQQKEEYLDILLKVNPASLYLKRVQERFTKIEQVLQ